VISTRPKRIAWPLVERWTRLRGRRSPAPPAIDDAQTDLILRTSQDGLCILHATGEILEANDALCRMLGYPRAELVGVDLSLIEAAETPVQMREHLRRVRTRGSDSFESRYRRKDGNAIDVQVSTSVLRAGAEVRVLASVRDISDRKQAERALRESEAKFAAAFQGSPDVMVINRTCDGLIVDVNRAYERFFGYKRDELVGRTSVELGLIAHPELRAPFVEKLLRDGKVEDMPWASRLRSGEVRETLQSGYAVEIAGERHHVAIIRDLTEQRKRDRDLRESEERLRQAVRVSDIGIFDHDQRSDRVYWSPEQRRIYGWEADEPITLAKFIACVHPDDSERIAAQIQRAHDPAGDGLFDVEHRILRRDGNVRWIKTRSQTFFEGEASERRPVRTVGAIADITQARAAEQALRDSEARYQTLIDTVPDPVLVHVGGRYVYANPAALQLLGARSADQIVGSDALSIVHPDSRDFARERISRQQRGEPVPRNVEQRWLRLDGTAVDVEVTGVPFMLGDKRAVHVISRDITERKQVQARIEHLAYHDALTQLPNRSLLLDRLQQALARCRRRGSRGALLFIDLDRFKTINDSLGHPIGDLLLREVARCLTSHVRAEDTVARLGGDEFIVLLGDIDASRDTTAHEARSVAEKIHAALAREFSVAGYTLHVGASIGMVVFPDSDESADDILRHADIAMYRAKTAGRDTICFFSPEMQAAVTERMHLEAQLRHALDNREFALHFQPQVEIATGRVIGAESLMRWLRPGRDQLSPAVFIPILEESGLILQTGDWVLRTACLIAATLAGSNPGFRVAVNVSPRQLHQASFAERVRAILDECQARPEWIELEITEGAIIQDIQDAVRVMTSLKQLGLHFSLDDFGTGYSSLSYLKRLPLDTLKIDRAFVRDCTVDPNDAAIVRAIIAMARSLEVQVVAEGVETQAQLRFLGEQGCNAYQGYYFSPPVPQEQLHALLQARGSSASNGARSANSG